MKKHAICLALTLLFWSLGCQDSSDPEVEWFSFVEEEASGQNSGGDGGGILGLCDFAPRFGTLAIVEVMSISSKIATPEELCGGDYPYQSAVYRQFNLKILHELAGPPLQANRINLKIVGKYNDPSNAAVGDLRLMTITPLLRGEHFALGEGYRVEPQPSETAALQSEARTHFRIPRNADQLESELRAYMAANPTLPERCGGNSIFYPVRDAGKVTDLMYLESDETRSECEDGGPKLESPMR